jgi:hypothetical protein
MGYRPVSLVVRRVAVLAGLLTLSPCGFGSAQVASTTADIAAYAGAGRTDKLIAGARNEGTVTV